MIKKLYLKQEVCLLMALIILIFNFNIEAYAEDSNVPINGLQNIPLIAISNAQTIPVKNLQVLELKTKLGRAPQLSATVLMDNRDGISRRVNVIWDTVDASLYAKVGNFTIEGTVQDVSEKAKANVTVIEGDGPLYSFQILSDTHLTADLNNIYDKNFDSALNDINNVDPSSSRIIINGDVTDNGLTENWEAFYKILSQKQHPKIDTSLGNHDTWQSMLDKDKDQYDLSKGNFLKYTGEPNIYYDYWLKDNHFIFLGSEKSNGRNAYFSDAQLKWFDETLAKDAVNNKPVFVFMHQPLYDTVAGSKPGQYWDGIDQDKAVKEILVKYPQAILFTGHTHWEFGSKYIMYNEKYCTMFNIPSCGYCWTDANIENDISEGYYVEVYKDKVLVKGRNFTTREWAENAQYEVTYGGIATNSTVKAIDNFAALHSKVVQLNNLELTTDKTTLVLNSADKAKLTLNATMTDGTKVDLTKDATIQYTSDNLSLATVDSKGRVTSVSAGLANITARVTVNGITESATQQIEVLNWNYRRHKENIRK